MANIIVNKPARAKVAKLKPEKRGGSKARGVSRDPNLGRMLAYANSKPVGRKRK